MADPTDLLGLKNILKPRKPHISTIAHADTGVSDLPIASRIAKADVKKPNFWEAPDYQPNLRKKGDLNPFTEKNYKGTNQFSPETKIQTDFITNYLKNNQITTLEGYENINKWIRDKDIANKVGFIPFSSAKSARNEIRKVLSRNVKINEKEWGPILQAWDKSSNEFMLAKLAENRNSHALPNYAGTLNKIRLDMKKNPNRSFDDSWDELIGQHLRDEKQLKEQRYDIKERKWNVHVENLEEHYPKLYDFFVDKVKFRRNPPKTKLSGKTEINPEGHAYPAYKKHDLPSREDANMAFKINEDSIEDAVNNIEWTWLHGLGEAPGWNKTATIDNLVTKYEMIPVQFLDEISRPKFQGTKKMNSNQMKIEIGTPRGKGGLIDRLIEKYELQGFTFQSYGESMPGGKWVYNKRDLTDADIKRLNQIDEDIRGFEKRLIDGDLRTVFFDPGKEKLVYFGMKLPEGEQALRLKRSEIVKKVLDPKFKEHKEGGLVRPNMSYGGDMAQFTEMESVVPELNPAEAGMEDYTQLAMSIPKFRNPFKKVDPPPIMSDAVSGIKIADKTKKGAKIEGTIRTEGQTPVFHLKSDLEIAGAVQDKMTPQQWNGYLLKKGVSETEMHEFGLGNLLKNIGGFDEGTKKWKNNAPITKADLIAQYKNNKPVISYKIQQIEPFEKGWKDFQSFLTGQKRGGSGYLGDLPSGARELEELRQLKNKPQDIIGDRLRSNIIKFSQEISDRTGRDIKSAWAELDPQITANINGIIKEAYGIENVVENGFGNVKVPFYTQNLVNRFRRLKKGEGFYMGKTGVGHEGAQFLKGGTGYIEIPFTYNPNPKGMRANEPRFKFGEGHFTNPKGNNPVFWLRASERVDERGKRVFLIEEIQSDMHQKPKQKPDTFTYAQRHDTPEFINKTFSLSQVKKLKDDLVKVSDQIDKITGHTDPSAVTIMERLKVKREALRNQIRESEDLIAQAAGKSDEVFPEGPWKKSENQAKIAIKTLINLATQEGFDSVAIISGKAKNHAVGASADIAKGNRGFYDNIAVSGMKNVAKNLDLEFSSTNIKDGDGNTWAKIPIINLKKEPVKASVDMYKAKGGYIHRPSFVDVVPVL